MLASVRWLNEYLVPSNLTAEGAERALTGVGFPIESHTELPDGDVRLDVEVTSNRGDCLSHLGLAREIAAATGGKLRMPAAAEGSTDPAEPRSVARIDNRVPELCRLFTARVIRAVKVGPSPAWMVRALESIGQRSINNVVDVTNYVAAEFGQPTHVFDLGTLRKAGAPPLATLVVRTAGAGERLKLLDGKTVELRPGELVIADGDGSRPVSLAGIMGGAETEVTGRTTDVLLEAATWDPATVRRAARRLGIRTDASHRFERIVDPRTIDAAARRAAALIVQVAGGKVLGGAIEAGLEAAPRAVVRLRPARCRAILGAELHLTEMARALKAHEIEIETEVGPWEEGAEPAGGELRCTIPPHRPDLEREIDLIEEVARTLGLDRLPIAERVGVRVSGEQREERAVREIGAVLTGLGFYETVTFTFVPPRHAEPFLPAGLGRIDVCDERRKADPTLRPSAIPSLLACRRANRDRGVDSPGGVRLFESSAAFAQTGTDGGGGAVERQNLAMICEPPPIAGAKGIERAQHAVRVIRAAIDSLAAAMGGENVKVAIEPVGGVPPVPAYLSGPGGCAAVMINGQRAGIVGLIAPAVLREYDLEGPIGAAELGMDPLVALYPPKPLVRALPEFPAIERDVSLIVPEATAWSRIETLVRRARLPLLDVEEAGAVRFVGVYRGPQAGEGKKSVTLRLRFRDPQRTLRREEVDPQVQAVADLTARELGATIRVS